MLRKKKPGRGSVRSLLGRRRGEKWTHKSNDSSWELKKWLRKSSGGLIFSCYAGIALTDNSSGEGCVEKISDNVWACCCCRGLKEAVVTIQVRLTQSCVDFVRIRWTFIQLGPMLVRFPNSRGAGNLTWLGLVITHSLTIRWANL